MYLSSSERQSSVVAVSTGNCKDIYEWAFMNFPREDVAMEPCARPVWLTLVQFSLSASGFHHLVIAVAVWSQKAPKTGDSQNASSIIDCLRRTTKQGGSSGSGLEHRSHPNGTSLGRRKKHILPTQMLDFVKEVFLGGG